MSEQLKLNIDAISIQKDFAIPFRPIHYLGSKLRLVNQIREIAFRVNPGAGRFCDLFSGSSTLSYAMSKHYDVTSIDVQEYSRVLASALFNSFRPTTIQLNNFMDEVRGSKSTTELNDIFSAAVEFEISALGAAARGEPQDIVTILENGSIKYATKQIPYVDETRQRIAQRGFLDATNASISSIYGGIYFSYRQSIEIDAIRNQIEKIDNPAFKSILLAALVSTVSGCVNTIGKQFAQPIRLLAKDGRVKTSLIPKIINDRNVDVFATYKEWLARYASLPIHVTNSRAIKGNYSDVLNNLHDSGDRFDIIYADPPYTRDHYSRYYHLIETLCLMDAPNISTATTKGETVVSRGLYREDRHQSPFCIKSQAPEAFSELFRSAVKFEAPLLLSYSPFSKANDDHPRLMDVAHIVDIGMSYYRNSNVTYFDDFSHSKLNSSGNNKQRVQEAEVLITFLP
jgi:adenine-specific DNA-methyltransferase